MGPTGTGTAWPSRFSWRSAALMGTPEMKWPSPSAVGGGHFCRVAVELVAAGAGGLGSQGAAVPLRRAPTAPPNRRPTAGLAPRPLLTPRAAVSEKHLVRVVAQLQQPLGLVMEFAEGRPIADKPNLEVRWGRSISAQAPLLQLHCPRAALHSPAWQVQAGRRVLHAWGLHRATQSLLPAPRRAPPSRSRCCAAAGPRARRSSWGGCSRWRLGRKKRQRLWWLSWRSTCHGANERTLLGC